MHFRVSCPIGSCFSTFVTVSNLKSHIYRKHREDITITYAVTNAQSDTCDNETNDCENPKEDGDTYGGTTNEEVHSNSLECEEKDQTEVITQGRHLTIHVLYSNMFNQLNAIRKHRHDASSTHHRRNSGCTHLPRNFQSCHTISSFIFLLFYT